jgi:threonine dehydrogenase-like Zn-dependent dehydrogenase
VKAAVYYGPGDVRVEEVSRPHAGEKGMVLKVGACGICNIVDVPHYKSSFSLIDAPPHFFDVNRPAKTSGIILGHEFSGEIVEVGPKVKGLKVGERVYGAIWNQCNKCEACLAGDFEHCAAPDAGGRAVNGAMAEYVLFPDLSYDSVISDKFVKLTDDMSYADGVLIEVLRLGIGLASKAKAGDTVLVIGQDIVGLGAVAQLKSLGVAKIITCDISDARLAASRELGPDVVIDERKENVYEAVMKATGNRGADVVLETSCRSESLQLSVGAVRPFGDIWLGTFYTSGPFFDPSYQQAGMIAQNITQKPGISIRCAWGTLGPWMPMLKIAVDMIRSGTINARKHISQEFPLSEAKKAFDVASDPYKAIKVIIKP